MANVYKFEVTCGNYTCPRGVTHKKGSKIESYLELDKLFSNAFSRLDSATEVPEENRLPALTEQEEEALPEGVDVTADFAQAEELGVTVKKVGKVFSVLEDGEVVEGGEKLLSKTEVKKFLTSLSE